MHLEILRQIILTFIVVVFEMRGWTGGRGTVIRCAESGMEGAESGVEGADSGVEGWGAGVEGAGSLERLGQEIDF